MQQLPTFEIVNSQLKFQTAPIQTVRIQDGPINNPTETLYQFYTETVMGILSRSKLAFFSRERRRSPTLWSIFT